VCIVDADSILERGSLRQVVLPLLTEPHTIAAGGCVRIVNGCEVRGGFIEKIGLPGKFLPLAQVIEYMHGFLFGRLGWAPMNAVPIVSGAFGVFRRQAVIDAGGYRSDTLGEDMELILRMHRLNRIAGRPYRIAFLVNPVCWTDAPESPGALRGQRIRWQRGLGESLMHNRGLLFHPRGGAAGWLMFPFMVLFELLGPVVELSGYVFMIAGFAFGFISAAAFWSFMLLAISIGALLSISALLLEEISCQTYRRPGNLFKLICMAIVENFGYHQLVLVWRLEGFYQWVTSAPARWGVMKRSGSLQDARQPRHP
jgi:cellulose synthase/poly-beta-1,6-N-acetylglucosamine synthase-like glycosyltransferase